VSDKGTSGEIATRSLVLRLVLLCAGMFGFGFLLVPAYDVFCDITGLGGRTNEQPAEVTEAPDATREIDLEFVTTVNASAPWTFRPAATRMAVHPGGLYEATFVATNLTDREKIAQAVPSVAPPIAAKHLKKIDCFCFTTQAFEPKETRDLLVRFVVDRALPDYVDTITLSYTLFDTARGVPATAAVHDEHTD
jgi:cytochrome c oxidase assembly protein subunit 11